MRHASTYVVVVESDQGRKSRTIGPYYTAKSADQDAEEFGKLKGRKAWSEPVFNPKQFRADPELPVSIGGSG
jgi:hypothetical protein